MSEIPIQSLMINIEFNLQNAELVYPDFIYFLSNLVLYFQQDIILTLLHISIPHVLCEYLPHRGINFNRSTNHNYIDLYETAEFTC